VPPSSRRCAASSASWPLAAGRSWRTPREADRSAADGSASERLPRIEISPPSPGAASRLPGHSFGCQEC
jgi:hypothetical protein